MTDAEKELATQWQARYEAFYRLWPGCFPEKLNPRILELDLERRQMLVGFRTEDWMVNPMGNVHGGILASMVDTAAGMLSKALIASWDGSPTVHLSINYLRPVALNRDLLLRASCQKAGRFLNYTSCTACYPERPDQALFTAECVYFAAAGRAV